MKNWKLIFLNLFCAIAICISAGCQTTRTPPRSYAPGELPRVIDPSVGEEVYSRCLQTEPDTYIFQTGRRVFRPICGSGPEVELLGTVHIAEPNYFKALQSRMDAAELVLFEGVKIDTLRKSNTIYSNFAPAISLVDQSTQIDTKRSNFVLCDMNMQQMYDLLEQEKKQGQKTGKEAAAALKELKKLEKLLVSKNLMLNLALWILNHSQYLKSQIRVRLVLEGSSFAKPESLFSPRLVRLLVDDRNEYALNRMDELLDKKPLTGRLIILYGSGHLSGMEKGLKNRGFLPQGSIEWENAVTIHPLAEGVKQRDIDKIMKKLEQKTRHPINEEKARTEKNPNPQEEYAANLEIN